MKLTLHALLRSYDIDPRYVRLVRHSDKEISVADTFRGDREKFTEYTAWQRDGKYGDAKYIAVFAPARGTTALFLVLWQIVGVTRPKDLTAKDLELLARHGLPEKWFHNRKSARYRLAETGELSDLSERLVIEWGGATVSWVQSKDKPVVEIRARNSIGEFDGYDAVQLSYEDVQRLVRDRAANATWVNALSKVNGVYLVRDTVTGALYVGSAYGKDGFLSRWSSYASSGHAGNKMLKGLEPRHLEFSVLEIVANTMSADDVIARENRWKQRLGTRHFGLNGN